MSMSMRRIFYLFMFFILLNGCAESVAFFGGATNGKIVQSSFHTVVSYGVKKQTGKTPFEHALSYVGEDKIEGNTSGNEIQPCVEFLEPVNKDICSVIKKKISQLSKIKNLN